MPALCPSLYIACAKVIRAHLQGRISSQIHLHRPNKGLLPHMHSLVSTYRLTLLISNDNHCFWPQIPNFVGVYFFHTGAGGRTNYLTSGPGIPVRPPLGSPGSSPSPAQAQPEPLTKARLYDSMGPSPTKPSPSRGI